MKEHYAGLGVYTTVGQAAVLLAVALRDLQHGPSRQECLEYIRSNKWLEIQPADVRPYPSASEPRWQTMISWARETLASKGLIDRSISDCWQPTKEGINSAVLVRKDFAEGVLDVRRCYMWTTKFKSYMMPDYVPDDNDVSRPPYVYEDELKNGRKSVRGDAWDKKTAGMTTEQIMELYL
jgi:hypothetical protein